MIFYSAGRLFALNLWPFCSSNYRFCFIDRVTLKWDSFMGYTKIFHVINIVRHETVEITPAKASFFPIIELQFENEYFTFLEMTFLSK